MDKRAKLKEYSLVALTTLISTPLVQSQGRNLTTDTNWKRGKTVYLNSCSPCHEQGSNMIDSTKKVIDSPVIKTKSSFRTFLSKQHAQMPPWKTILRSDSEVSALYAYVRTLR